jgi:signal peptidase I
MKKATPLTLFTIGTALIAIRRRFMLVDVNGDSMAPTLVPGDRLLISRVRRTRSIRRGTIVVLKRGESALLPSDAPVAVRRRAAAEATTIHVIKRLVALPGDPVPPSVRPAVNGAKIVPDGKVVILGDNSKSADSRIWGFVPVTDVLGIVRLKIS